MSKNIFNIKWSKRKEFTDKFIGLFISVEMVTFLNLYCIAFETPQSSIVRSAIIKWIGGTKKTEIDLIKKIACMVQDNWDKRKHDENKTCTFITFIKETKLELMKKRLTEIQADEILKKITK